MTFTHYKNADQLCRWMAERTGGTCLLSFSCGKEAVASMAFLRRYFHTIHPVYYYLVPGLSFVERSLEYYENIFQTRIIRVPNPNLIRMLNDGTYQTPRTYEIIKSFAFPNITYDGLFELVAEDLQLPVESTWTAIGVRAFDNLNRYGSIKKYGAHSEKRRTFFPIYDLDIKGLAKLLKEENLRLPIDYRIWGKSFDGLDYRFLKPIYDRFPEDFQKIKSFFPLIEADIFRYGKVKN